MQTILGAGGTIGIELAKELSRYTDRVRLVSRNPKKINPTDELLPADLTNPAVVDKAVEGSDVVYVTVGFEYTTAVWRAHWAKLMQAVIDACIRHNAKLVFFDNVYLYDAHAIKHMTEESPVNPPSEKGKVRAQVVKMIWDNVQSGKLTALIARSADFYGPRNEKSFLIETVYKNLKKGKRAQWFCDASKIHSFTYTPDAAKATALLGNTPDAFNQTWHLPTDNRKLTGKEIITLFAKEMNAKDGVTVISKFLVTVLGLFMPFMREVKEMLYQYDRDYFFDSSKFTKRFNIQATPYETGVKETIAFFTR